MRSLVGFCIVGCFGFAIDSAILLLLSGSGFMSPLLARGFSFTVAVAATWVGNTKISFRNSGKALTLGSFANYLLYQSFGLIINLSVYSALVLIGDTGMSRPFPAVAAASLAAMTFNYFALNRMHFAESGKPVKPIKI